MIYENQNLTKTHAIVIEDDIELRELFVDLLRIHNVHVIGTGSNGKEAYELYKI
jgi:chemotaxis response regulator CheB